MKPVAVRAIVTDIEGTTGSIAFVKEVLFPYAEARLRDFVATNPARVAPVIEEVRRLEGDAKLSAETAADRLLAWAREDRKIAPLKTLQGMIWAEGYHSGELKGHVYADAERALRRWNAAGLPLYVYSSGSVEAQKLLFGHSLFGDLTPLFSGYFDTRIGSKLDPASYDAIAREIAVAPQEILFLSDHPGEIAAANTAGWRTQLVDRDGGAPGAIKNFDEIIVHTAV